MTRLSSNALICLALLTLPLYSIANAYQQNFIVLVIAALCLVSWPLLFYLALFGIVRGQWVAAAKFSAPFILPIALIILPSDLKIDKLGYLFRFKLNERDYTRIVGERTPGLSPRFKTFVWGNSGGLLTQLSITELVFDESDEIFDQLFEEDVVFPEGVVGVDEKGVSAHEN